MIRSEAERVLQRLLQLHNKLSSTGRKSTDPAQLTLDVLYNGNSKKAKRK